VLNLERNGSEQECVSVRSTDIDSLGVLTKERTVVIEGKSWAQVEVERLEQRRSYSRGGSLAFDARVLEFELKKI
jgi:hypothetical protein